MMCRDGSGELRMNHLAKRLPAWLIFAPCFNAEV